MKDSAKQVDTVLAGSLAALKRAAKRAMRRAIETRTPLYVLENGKIVDLTKRRKRKRVAP